MGRGPVVTKGSSGPIPKVPKAGSWARVLVGRKEGALPRSSPSMHEHSRAVAPVSACARPGASRDTQFPWTMASFMRLQGRMRSISVSPAPSSEQMTEDMREPMSTVESVCYERPRVPSCPPAAHGRTCQARAVTPLMRAPPSRPLPARLPSCGQRWPAGPTSPASSGV